MKKDYLSYLKTELKCRYGEKLKDLKVKDLINLKSIEEISLSEEEYNNISKEGIYLVDKKSIKFKERGITVHTIESSNELDAIKIYYSNFLYSYLSYLAPDAKIE